MIDSVFLAAFNSVLRAVLASIGGYLVAKGIVSADVWTTIANHILGILLIAIPAAWGAWAKWRDRNKVAP